MTGTSLDDVTEVAFVYTDPAGNSGTIVWNEANGLLDSRFNPSSNGTSATFSPTLIASGDPVGLYRWTISVTNGSETILREFTVTYIYGPQQLPVTNTGPDTLPSDVVWGVITDNSQPELVDFGTANSTQLSQSFLEGLQQRAALLQSASTAIELYDNLDGLISELSKISDAAQLLAALNELGFNTENIATAEAITKGLLVTVANMLVDKAYDDAAANGFSTDLLPKPVAKAILNNAIYIATLDVDGSIAGLIGQFGAIAREYLALTAQNEQLVVNELGQALLELETYQAGDLSYSTALAQAENFGPTIDALREGIGGVWNEQTAQKIEIIGKLQSIRLRQLAGEDVTAEMGALSEQYREFSSSISGLQNINDYYYQFATQVALQLGLNGW